MAASFLALAALTASPSAVGVAGPTIIVRLGAVKKQRGGLFGPLPLLTPATPQITEEKDGDANDGEHCGDH